MSQRTLKELLESARRDPEYHKELAILKFTEELCRVMQEQGVSRTELGRRIGSSQAYISRVLNGGANFTLATMTKLAAALGMELEMHLTPARAHTDWHDTPLAGKQPPLAGRPQPARPEANDETNDDALAVACRDRAEETLAFAEAALPAAVETLPKR